MVIGNDTVLPCNEAIAIMVKFSCHVFHMICYLLECSKDYGLYIGQKAMYELEGGADFRNLSFHFLMRSLNLYAGQTVKIKPRQSKMVPLCIDTHIYIYMFIHNQHTCIILHSYNVYIMM